MFIEGVLEGGVSYEKLVSARARKIYAMPIEIANAAGSGKTIHVKGYSRWM